MAEHRDVPAWKHLPDRTQRALHGIGYSEHGFDTKNDADRLTVLNLYVKLAGMNLWRFVAREGNVGSGCFEFYATDVDALKKELTARPEFASPSSDPNDWNSAENRMVGALHLKHFSGWSGEPKRVQAHIDHAGRWMRNPILRVPGTLVSIPAHLIKYNSYSDPFGAREILLKQGWDPQSLLGTNAPL